MTNIYALFYKADGSANDIRFVAVASKEELIPYANEKRLGQGTFYIAIGIDNGQPMEEIQWIIPQLRAEIFKSNKQWPNASVARM